MKKRWWIFLVVLALVSLFHQKILYHTWVIAVDIVCDGEDIADVQLLDPRLSKKILPIMEQLKKEGFSFQVSSVYRSKERQKCLYDMSKKIKKWSRGRLAGVTSTKRSCHNHTQNNTPSSLAIDLHQYASHEQNVAYYLRLRELVRTAGLVSGGDFFEMKSSWNAYGLGWDPGHVQISGCKDMLP